MNDRFSPEVRIQPPRSLVKKRFLSTGNQDVKPILFDGRTPEITLPAFRVHFDIMLAIFPAITATRSNGSVLPCTWSAGTGSKRNRAHKALEPNLTRNGLEELDRAAGAITPSE